MYLYCLLELRYNAWKVEQVHCCTAMVPYVPIMPTFTSSLTKGQGSSCKDGILKKIFVYNEFEHTNRTLTEPTLHRLPASVMEFLKSARSARKLSTKDERRGRGSDELRSFRHGYRMEIAGNHTTEDQTLGNRAEEFVRAPS
jgi:hypothetical protein